MAQALALSFTAQELDGSRSPRARGWEGPGAGGRWECCPTPGRGRARLLSSGGEGGRRPSSCLWWPERGRERAGEPISTAAWDATTSGNHPRVCPMAQLVKTLPATAGDARDVSSIPELGRSLGEGNGTPLQYSCLENPVDRGAWWDTVHEVPKGRARLSACTHTHTRHLSFSGSSVSLPRWAALTLGAGIIEGEAGSGHRWPR